MMKNRRIGLIMMIAGIIGWGFEMLVFKSPRDFALVIIGTGLGLIIGDNSS
jgi:hypothetical protein